VLAALRGRLPSEKCQVQNYIDSCPVERECALFENHEVFVRVEKGYPLVLVPDILKALVVDLQLSGLVVPPGFEVQEASVYERLQCYLHLFRHMDGVLCHVDVVHSQPPVGLRLAVMEEWVEECMCPSIPIQTSAHLCEYKCTAILLPYHCKRIYIEETKRAY
jgi:hypothetical protein